LTDERFHKLAEAELSAVYRLACHLLRNSQEAEDCVQETYLRAYRSAGTFKLGEQGIRPWLFKILHNVIYTQGSRHVRELSAMEGLREMSREDGPAGGRMVDCSTMDWELVDERLKTAVEELAMPYREVFLLSALEALKYDEIAEVTEVPVGTVMSRLSRARSILAARLVDLGSETGFKSGRGSSSIGLKAHKKISEQTEP
jgi:RNA polymerase sigma-70 factor (ECF subfamily)